MALADHDLLTITPNLTQAYHELRSALVGTPDDHATEGDVRNLLSIFDRIGNGLWLAPGHRASISQHTMRVDKHFLSSAFDDDDEAGHTVGSIETYLGDDDDCIVQAIRRSAGKMEGDWETIVSVRLNDNGKSVGGSWSAVHKPNALSGADERKELSFSGDGGQLDLRKNRYGLNASSQTFKPPGKVDILSLFTECMFPKFIPRDPAIKK